MSRDPDRIRGRALQKIRREHFKLHPFCVRCQAKSPPQDRLATELDHIKPLHQGGTDTHDNRQGLCADCHVEKSKLERGHEYRPKVRIGLDGFPIE